MKKIALLGDSIRLSGYGPKVPEILGDEFEVWQPSDNCRFSTHTLRGIFDWKKDLEGCDVIHWNNGIWDAVDTFGDGPFTPPEMYVFTMKRIAKILFTYSKHVIFATTTPVNNPDAKRDYEIIKAYNALVVPELEKMGVVINDLHRTVDSNKDLYICSDTVHLSEEGARVCAEQVAECIRNVLK